MIIRNYICSLKEKQRQRRIKKHHNIIHELTQKYSNGATQSPIHFEDFIRLNHTLVLSAKHFTPASPQYKDYNQKYEKRIIEVEVLVIKQ